MSHIPVLLNEVLEGLEPAAGETFVDATLGGGGHSQAIAERLGPSGRLIAIDVDSSAIALAREKLQVPGKLDLVLGNFRQIKELVEPLAPAVDGILMDLGFRSDQLLAGKGLSFERDEPLSMTLGESSMYSFTAKEIVNDWEEAHVADIIRYYGEERFAGRIARAIVQSRKQGEISSTLQLVAIIESAVPKWYRIRRLHPATKTFQALRIAVNDELDALRDGLTGSWELLQAGGRLGVISFHGLEARIVKNFFKEKKLEGGQLITRKAITASREEIRLNPRSRSAQLRIISKK
jgi:16S rRNA (cytosine1402-N4)-methyltransferase